MAKRSQKNKKTKANQMDIVVVTFAEDMEQAKNYETLLKANDIPAMIKEQNDNLTNINSITVMVPEDFLDEAHVVIESQNSYEDFYDMTMNEVDDFDDNFLDDDDDFN